MPTPKWRANVKGDLLLKVNKRREPRGHKAGAGRATVSEGRMVFLLVSVGNSVGWPRNGFGSFCPRF